MCNESLEMGVTPFLPPTPYSPTSLLPCFDHTQSFEVASPPLQTQLPLCVALAICPQTEIKTPVRVVTTAYCAGIHHSRCFQDDVRPRWLKPVITNSNNLRDDPHSPFHQSLAVRWYFIPGPCEMTKCSTRLSAASRSDVPPNCKRARKTLWNKSAVD